MSAYLKEAAYLAAEIPSNRCPSTDALVVLDAHPEIRLVLEDTWSDRFGRVYREVPADRVSRWPSHLAKTFRSFLRISRKPAQVFKLLDLLHELDADQAVVKMTLSSCRKRKTLTPAITYYKTLTDELKTVTGDRCAEEVPLGTGDVRCRPRFNLGEAEPGTWYLAEGQDDPETPVPSPCYRAELLHDPLGVGHQTDWIESQPRSWRTLYRQIQLADVQTLPALKDRLIHLPEDSWTHDQLKVLWDAYRIRRDYFRHRQESLAAQKLSPMARKLIKRVRRSSSRTEIAHVGVCLYQSMRGEIRLPGPVTQPEWAVVFDAYRSRKSEILSAC